MATAKLNVTGMHCGHCQEKVTKALRGVAGVYSAVVDWQDGEAEVDKLAKRFLAEVHRLVEPAHEVRGAY